MTKDDVAILRRSIDKRVIICFTDGEIITAIVDSVDENDGEVVYQMLSTNQVDKPAYAEHGLGAPYLLRFGDVEHVETDY